MLRLVLPFPGKYECLYERRYLHSLLERLRLGRRLGRQLQLTVGAGARQGVRGGPCTP